VSLPDPSALMELVSLNDPDKYRVVKVSIQHDERVKPVPAEPKLYRELAEWFHLLTSPDDYAVEADFYGRLLRDSAEIRVKSVLELGSGGGNNASHMKARLDLALTDLSREMLDLSRKINPECEHIQGDMRTLRLGRQFDAVFAHDAVSYMTTEDDLRAAIVTAFDHCKPGGAAVFGPDEVAETFDSRTDHGGHDGPKRSLRYLEWTWDPDPKDSTYFVDYAYMLREGDDVRVEHDRHVCGVFSRTTWLRLLEETGFRARRREGIEGETALDVFVGVKSLCAFP
jgi:SAM-dependent methyltransferase